MKKKLKYNFLHITPFHYSKFCDSFLFCCAQGCHFFVMPSDQQGGRKANLLGGKVKKGFTKLFYIVAILYRYGFHSKNVVMTKKSHHFQPVSKISIFVPNFK